MATARGHSRPVLQQVFACQGCGATFILPPQQLTLTCPYCESAYVVKESQARELVVPEGVIPFAVSEKSAQQALRDWLQKLQLAVPVQVADGRGLYLPAWTFDLGGQVNWRCMIKVGRDPLTRKDKWEPRVDLELVYYNDMLIPASQRLPEACRAELAGYNLAGLVPYAESYLADWPAETYQVTVGDASLEARKQAYQKEQEKVRHKLYGDQVRDLSFSSLGILVESFKLVLLPAWLTHFTFEQKRYDVIVNGQTGRVSGSRPTGKIRGLFDKIMK
jgi:DNA-directed RNA polymerase subunit RPC12/RpoP